MDIAQLVGWLPIRLYWHHDQPLIDWCYFGERRLTQPFFEQTVATCFRHPFNLLFRHQTPVDALEELQATQPGIPPTGFIFHMSRCGSTLVSQMLASLPHAVVLSEAPPIDHVLRTRLRDPAISNEQRIHWLRGMISALGQRRTGEERYCFVKFDCWHTLDLPLIQQAFPDVPWIFVYRDPLEVLVSHAHMPGIQMVPGMIPPAAFGFDPTSVAQMRHDEYAAHVLAHICSAALDSAHLGTGRVISYRQLPAVVWQSLLNMFDVHYSRGDLERMQAVTQFSAKEPSLTFQDDTAVKQQAASERLRQLADQWVEPLYQHLEILCAAQDAHVHTAISVIPSVFNP